MRRSDLKYLFAYLIPLLVGVSLYLRGPWVFLALAVVFGLVPVIESRLPADAENHPPEAEAARARSRFFDLLLYLNVPIQYGLLGYYLWIAAAQPLAAYEWAGMILTMGLACGVLGINVAHELGHRKPPHEQRMAQALLLTSLYLHFFIEHNRGHHRHVATPLDPATARHGEPLYAFWLRSVTGSFRSAWRLEAQRLAKAGRPAWTWDNQMLRFQLIQAACILGIFALGGWKAGLAFLAAAAVGFLLLETVNYLEHYGLERRMIRPGVYERVMPRHSWNSDQIIGRILLYELTRHSDHHHLASRKYQILRHEDESPQLPAGYPAMMLLALAPPLWFRVMDRKLEAWKKSEPGLG
ncbi:MAG: alkane 1-monooxygenase [Bacteroidia bacterium]|nr:alkane 1-monooxygenase [Bacteroidia bacterium]